MRINGSSDTSPVRLALHGTLPQPVISSRSSNWAAFTVEFYRARSIDVVSQCSYHTISVITGERFDLYQRRNGKELRTTMRAGDVIITPAGPPKQWRHEDEAEFIAVRMPPSFLQRIIDEERGAAKRRTELLDNFQTRDAHIEQLVKRLLGESMTKAYATKIYAEALATELGVHLLRNYCVTRGSVVEHAHGLPIYKLRRATEFIEENLREDLTLDRISEVLAMSPGHFAHAFKQTTGLAPHHYVVERRIDRAKGLLRKSDLPISEIAHRVGFRNQSHFSFAFRRATGVTPREFRGGS
ncbi:MAG TPA: AraC family transcriptional regulator [Casimicrobiaceae bacterium]|jgi:AraC family transcriptional regulator